MCPHAQIQWQGSSGTNGDAKKIRCVLVHDHVLLRQGLRRLLEDEPEIEVAAEAGNAAEALLAVLQHHPEVVITDAGIFECAAKEAERLILQDSPQSKVLFLSMHEGERLPEGRADGTSCAVRETSAEELVEMVRRLGHSREGGDAGNAAKRARRVAAGGTASAQACSDGAGAGSFEVAGRGSDGAFGGRCSGAQR